MVYLLFCLAAAGGTPDMTGYDFVNKCVAVIEDRGESDLKLVI